MTDDSSALHRWSRLKRKTRADKKSPNNDSAVVETDALQEAQQAQIDLGLQLDTSGVTPDLPDVIVSDDNTDGVADGIAENEALVSDVATDGESIEEPLLSDEDMPELSTLTPQSDISMFFNRGVSIAVRKAALKFVFQLAPYNIRDGLNDYDEDYTVFEPLGDTITCDMKFHQERKEREAREALEEEARLAEQQKEAERSAEDTQDDESQDNDEQDDAQEDSSESEQAEAEPADEQSNDTEPNDSSDGVTSEDDIIHADAGQTNDYSAQAKKPIKKQTDEVDV